MGDSAIHALAGAVGGGVSMALTYPLVNLSTRAAVATKKEDMNIVEAISKSLRTEGLSGLYAGLGSSLFGIALTNGVYTAAYEEVRSRLLRRRPMTSTTSTGALTALEGIVAGLIAGSITTTLTNPVWTVQAYQSTRAVAAGGDQKPSAIESFKAIYRQDGVAGLWRGLGPALILVLNPVIQYTTFERLVSILLKYRTKHQGVTPNGQRIGVTGRSALTNGDLFLLGAVSKLIATGSTYPILVVKSRLQAATHQYKSSLKAILQILNSEGIAGLYAGLSSKLLQSALTAAFMFVAQRRIYEFAKGLIVAAAQRKAAIAAAAAKI